MVKNSFGTRGVETTQPELIVPSEPDVSDIYPDTGTNLTALLTVGLIAIGVVAVGLFAWSQKETISGTIDGWKHTVAQWQDSPSDKKKFAYKEKSLGSYSILGVSARIARLAKIDYKTSPLKDPKNFTSNPSEFINSYNYDVFVKATKLFAMAYLCNDNTAKLIAVTLIKISSGRGARDVKKLAQILKKGDRPKLTSSERDCKRDVPALVNELMGMV